MHVSTITLVTTFSFSLCGDFSLIVKKSLVKNHSIVHGAFFSHAEALKLQSMLVWLIKEGGSCLCLAL